MIYLLVSAWLFLAGISRRAASKLRQHASATPLWNAHKKRRPCSNLMYKHKVTRRIYAIIPTPAFRIATLPLILTQTSPALTREGRYAKRNKMLHLFFPIRILISVILSVSILYFFSCDTEDAEDVSLPTSVSFCLTIIRDFSLNFAVIFICNSSSISSAFQ